MPRRSVHAWPVVLVALGCGGNEFQGDGGEAGEAGAGRGGSASGGTGAGGTGTGGSAGNAGMPTGGSAGSGGAAGSGGGGSGGVPGCDCAPTEYCRGGQCLSCSELATLDFGDPELLLDDPALPIRFPRAGDTPSSLFYRAGDEGAASLRYTPSPSQIGVVIGNAMVTQSSGPLFVADLDPDFNLLFDQTVNDERFTRVAMWDGSTLGPDSDMPAPLSPGGFEDYSVAATTATPMVRVYWMSTRDGAAQLRTGRIGTGESNVVTIDVPKRTGSGTCPREGSDATPWVTADGRRMFFRAFPLDADCQPLDAMTTDLFVVPLEPTSGMPSAPALALASLNEVGATDTDPSLSADFCTIFFASDRDSFDADFKLFRAHRR